MCERKIDVYIILLLIILDIVYSNKLIISIYNNIIEFLSCYVYIYTELVFLEFL